MFDWLTWAPIIGTVLVAVIGGTVALANRKGSEKDRQNPSWKELVDENRLLRADLRAYRKETESRFEEMELKIASLVRVVHTLADQWPADRPLPTLNTQDLETIEHTIPPKFRPRKHRG